MSIAAAQRKAEALHLENVQFEHEDLDTVSPSGTYDCIVATHALVQSETGSRPSELELEELCAGARRDGTIGI